MPESIEVSPLPPYSRTDRVIAMGAASLVSLLLYIGWLTWLLLLYVRYKRCSLVQQ